MSTAQQGDARRVPPRSWITVLGQLSAAVVILTPLVAMIFPELNHRSGNAPSKNRPTVSAPQSASNVPSLSVFSAKRIDP